MISRFNLLDLPARERRAVLHDQIAPMVAGQFHNVDETFEMSGAIMHLPGVNVLRGANGAATIRSYGSDDKLLLGWTREPWRGESTQFGKCVNGSERAAVLASLSDPFESLIQSRFLPVQVQIARRDLLALAPRSEAMLMRPLWLNDPSFKLLRSYLAALWRDGLPASAHSASVVASHVRDLVALVVGAHDDLTGSAVQGGVSAARLAAAKQFVERNLSHPTLSIARTAHDQGVSTRRIQALFEADGTTFTEHVARVRLARAFSRLTNPLLSNLSISEIAYDAGFRDLSHFNRSFRSTYGGTPSDFRKRQAGYPEQKASSQSA